MAAGIFGDPCISGHTVYVYDRGGTMRVAQLIDVAQVTWTRDRDGISETTIRVQGSACSEQAETLAAIEPKRSEIVIFRGKDRVWEGPVWRVGWHQDYVEINAHDVMAYIMSTPLSQAYSSAYPNVETVTGRIERILTAELQRWEDLEDQNPIAGQPPIPKPANILPYIQVHHFENEARTTAVTKPFEMTVGEHIQSLGRTAGIDWTVLGRSLHVWDTSRSLGKTRTLTEADFFEEVIVTAYGADLATEVYVVGQDGVYGHASAPNPYYGPWTMILTAYNEEGTTAPSQEELDSQAKRNLNGRQPVPVEVRVPDNSGIRLNESLTIYDMVPGVQVPLLATLNSRKLSQLQKIDFVTVTETPEGETIQVTLTPATKPDSDTEEP